MSGFILSFDADDDLQNIYNFSVARFGRGQARQYLSELYETLDRIADYPEIGRRRPELGMEIRMLPHRSHVVFFMPWRDGVGIARVLHGAMDFESAFENYDAASRMQR